MSRGCEMAPNGGKRTGNPRSESYPCCALAQGALIQGDTRNPGSLFAYRIDRRRPKFHYACRKFELRLPTPRGHL